MASILPILSIVGAVRRHKQRKEVKAELEAAREERAQAAEERRQMREELAAGRVNNNSGYYNSNGYEYTNAESPNSGYAYAQPEGTPVYGVPVQAQYGAPAMSGQAYAMPTYTTAAGTVSRPAMEYCGHCDRYHEPPMCPLTRREARRQRREERREERRAERRRW